MPAFILAPIGPPGNIRNSLKTQALNIYTYTSCIYIEYTSQFLHGFTDAACFTFLVKICLLRLCHVCGINSAGASVWSMEIVRASLRASAISGYINCNIENGSTDIAFSSVIDYVHRDQSYSWCSHPQATLGLPELPPTIVSQVAYSFIFALLGFFIQAEL